MVEKMENCGEYTFSFSDAAANSLTVKANGRHGIEILIKFKSVQGGRLSGAVETEHRHVERSSRGKCLEQTATRAASTHPSAHPSLSLSSPILISFPLLTTLFLSLFLSSITFRSGLSSRVPSSSVLHTYLSSPNSTLDTRKRQLRSCPLPHRLKSKRVPRLTPLNRFRTKHTGARPCLISRTRFRSNQCHFQY